jgi:hypothetical protein
LNHWLKKCSPTLCDAIADAVGVEWSLVCTVWSNRIRYYSHEAWLGHARKTQEWMKQKKGSNDDKIREFTKQFVVATQAIHNKGLAEWQRRQK